MCARCRHQASTLLRHLPPIEESYSGPVIGCGGRRKGLGEQVQTVKLHADLVQGIGGGVKGHRQPDAFGRQVMKVDDAPAWVRAGEGSVKTSSPASLPHITPVLEDAREAGGRGVIRSPSLSGGGCQGAASSRAPPACHMLQPTLVLFSQSHHTFDMNCNTF